MVAERVENLAGLMDVVMVEMKVVYLVVSLVVKRAVSKDEKRAGKMVFLLVAELDEKWVDEWVEMKVGEWVEITVASWLRLRLTSGPS